MSSASIGTSLQRKAFSSLPGPRRFPLVGNWFQIDPKRFHWTLENWAKQYGEQFQFSLGSRRIVVCSNSDTIAEILKDRPKGYGRTTLLSTIAKELGLAGLFSNNGDIWRRQRTLVMAVFQPANVRAYFPSMLVVANRYLKRWDGHAEKNTYFELVPDLMRFTVDVTAGLALGTDTNTIEADGDIIQKHLASVFKTLQRRLLTLAPYWRIVKLPQDFKIMKDVRFIQDAVASFIKNARAAMVLNPERAQSPTNMVEAMLAARDENGAEFSDEDISGNIVTMLLAGEDTTATSLAWIFHLLSEHPAVVEKLQVEVGAVLGEARTLLRYEQFAELPYVGACINEALRLFPVAPALVLQAHEDKTIGGTTIPAKTSVILLCRAASTSKEHFGESTEFRPERWLGPAAEGDNRKASIPFGAGARVCPGRHLAIDEMKMVVSMLIKNFTIEKLGTLTGAPVEERLELTLIPVGLHLQLRPRKALGVAPA